MQSHRLSRLGEFVTSATEASYQADRLPEALRQAKWLFLGAGIVNVLFYLNDFHFLGAPHFASAIVARTVIVGVSFLALLLLRRSSPSVAGLRRLCLGWSVPVALAGGVLVSPHTGPALLVIFALPPLFHLALPVSVGGALVIGWSASAVLLASYLSGAPLDETSLGQGLGMLTLNVILALVLITTSRLRRMEWAATRAAQAANRELSQHREILRCLLRAVPTPLVIATGDTLRVIEVNDAARAYFGEEIQRDRPLIETYLDAPAFRRLADRLDQPGNVASFETTLHFADGSTREVLLAATATEFNGSPLALLALVDISERIEMEARLKHLASTDPLTGLANRALFFATADVEIKRMRRLSHPLAVVMVDIDFFKRINDTHGHDAGDAALSAFAKLCHGSLRGHDLAARLGGEEFALLLPETTPEEALALAERLRREVSELTIPGTEVRMTISAGVSAVTPGEGSVEDALARADRALYGAKNGGRNRVMADFSTGTEPSPVAPL